jgi:hypothetical protein
MLAYFARDALSVPTGAYFAKEILTTLLIFLVPLGVLVVLTLTVVFAAAAEFGEAIWIETAGEQIFGGGHPNHSTLAKPSRRRLPG